MNTVTLAEARRMALAAQGFGQRRPRKVTARDLAATIRRLGLLQLDFVNVVVPSHYLVVFSRLGPYERGALHRAIYGGKDFTEQWAHEASVVPMETWPLLRHRRETHISRPWGFDEIMAEHHEYVETAIDEITTRGPLGAADLPDPTHTSRRLPESWYGSVPRAVLEACFGRGQLSVTDRRENFSRVYDLAERVVPAEHFSRAVSEDEARRALLLAAARGCGVGTAADLADYFRMKVGEAKPRINELVESGDLRAVEVEGWRDTAFVPRGAGLPPVVDARALLSPFDPVIWFRPRTARLFQFNYRFEIFVPEAKRKWGSYVLPFLYGDRLAARVDAKVDRRARCLLVAGAWLESWAKAAPVADALAAELRALASWLGLEGVRVGRRGNFARSLSAAVRSGHRAD
ncbi:MAG: winged helix DNA-binding domain-containing protein [Acidobacteria bacterium]|nr:winged helix DNA-binding domain-containing protein [Acidobacteriota bacterium]